jgi:hypothetical protein
MSKHTPGPWTVERGRDRTHPYGIMGDGFDLARCVDVNDAALIAAAPDLLAVLAEVEPLLAVLDQNSIGHNGYARSVREALMNVRAAIAKAQGESE